MRVKGHHCYAALCVVPTQGPKRACCVRPFERLFNRQRRSRLLRVIRGGRGGIWRVAGRLLLVPVLVLVLVVMVHVMVLALVISAVTSMVLRGLCLAFLSSTTGSGCGSRRGVAFNAARRRCPRIACGVTSTRDVASVAC